MSHQNELVLVTGATGHQGGATARQLLAAGRPVRALVRDPNAAAAQALAELGAELAVGDFDRPETLTAAVAGAGGVFLVPPAAFGPGGWDVDLEANRGVALVDAARSAGVEQIVFTGVASFGNEVSFANHGKHRIEEAARASGLRYTLLRPVRFMENFLGLAALPLDGFHGGVNRHIFRTDRPVQMIAVDDIGAIAALAFADPDRFHGLALDLAGDAHTPPESAEIIGRAVGHPLRYQRLTEAEADALTASVGDTWRLAEAGHGWEADIAAVRAILPGLQNLETWLTTTGAAQLKAVLAV
ncbi:NmrA/HSCARG family protein [Nocardia sp. alder85J]|uniref:NmrA/HSCARG family protein n=1 Tax=Nocardia sp. alder85J TaxID=2862949 RepID=UPI001CD1CB87|nr:NmrA/HSCARG family protein [Nocardia sp. alder85J]MCX4094070.1 NmrA/HSCARG family protein [Nocardia sp. alder85J]